MNASSAGSGSGASVAGEANSWRSIADELLTTTRSVRSGFDYSRPVPASVLGECLEIALQAPSGGNEQLWEWVFVTEPSRRLVVAEAYRATMRETAPPEVFERDDPQIRAVRTFVERLHDMPVMVIPCYRGRVEGMSAFYQASHWGSILPAAWSFMLALRTRGLATRWTTLHLGHEREVADALGIPFADVTQACMLPVAYTTHSPYVRGQRLQASGHVHWNSWGDRVPRAVLDT